MPETIKRLEKMLQEAKEKRSWGSIEIDLKDGRVYLLRQTVQIKPDEDYPSERCWK
jgi:hypothetical protein